MKRNFCGWLAGAALALTCSSARCEVFVLAHEGQIRGELLNKDEIPRKKYVIKTDNGQITLSRALVKRVLAENPDEVEYERIRHDYADTAAEQWELAEWCREHKLSASRKVHLDRVIEHEPDHLKARRALGYMQVKGQWKTQADIKIERGYQFYKGRWVLPQEIELEEDRRKADLAEKAWFKKIKRWRSWMRGDKSAEAFAELAEIDDPMALKAVKLALERETDERLKLVFLGVLERIGTYAAMEVLVNRSMEDASEEVRLTSLDLLTKHRHPDLTTLYVKSLKHKDNLMVNRAALGLLHMQDPSSIGPLIDALVTTHKFTVTSGSPGTTGSFDNRGGGGTFSQGQSTQVFKRDFPNETVRDALVAMTGVNFSYDVTAWKNWYATQKKSGRLNARRD